ncbi:MAG: hydroxymethylbilane synthase [Oscillospiraceae bacterium]
MNRTIRIGSRDSKLALIQTQLVIDNVQKYHPDIEIELIKMKTTGDKILDKTLDEIGGKGVFVKELDEALLEGKVDLTVHSYKDLPMVLSEILPIVALSKRADPRDVLILPSREESLKNPIGCSSKRRQLQLKTLFPDRETAPIRGNIGTRLEKLDRGEYSALVLAAAGIERLGLGKRIARYFTTDEILPAASQGIIAVQGRLGEDYSYLSHFNSEESCYVSLAERSFVRALEGGCTSPVAAYAQILGENILIKGFYEDEWVGSRVESISGYKTDAEFLGEQLAKKCKEQR